MLIFYALASVGYAQNRTGTANCLSGRINFDPIRMFAIGRPADAATLDPSVYDMTIDYGSLNVKQNNPGVDVAVTLNQGTGQGAGARLSTVRYIQYARISAKMRAVPVPGIVTTFITMSPRKDEIDWEFVGSDATHGQTNIFYKGILEFGLRSENNPTGPIDGGQEFTIDWKSDAITWYVNGNLVRTYSINSPLAVSRMTPPGEKSYPSEASQVQIGVWDGGGSPSAGVSQWAGGRVPWNGRVSLSAQYEYIDIQCYDNRNNPVPKWPNTPTNPDRREASASQPTAVARPAAAQQGSDGSGNSYQVPSIAAVAPLPTLPTTSSSLVPDSFSFASFLLSIAMLL